MIEMIVTLTIFSILVALTVPTMKTWIANAKIRAVADTLRRCATLICDGSGHPVDDPTLVRALEDSTRRLDELIDALKKAQ